MVLRDMTFFVSYTTRDSYVDRDLLECISEVLSNYGDFYIDLLHNDSNNKQRHVEEMLSQADLLLVVSSSSIRESEWVRWELAEAESNGIPIIEIQATPNRNETINNLKVVLSSRLESLISQSTRMQLSCTGF